MHWLTTSAERRSNPRTLWPEVRSIIMLGLNYGPAHDPSPSSSATTVAPYRSTPWVTTTHEIIKPRLKSLARWLVAHAGGDVKVFVDTAAVMEKPLAQAAALAGKANTQIWCRVSMVPGCSSAQFSHTLALAPDTAENDHCGNCRACLDICPTNAFPAPYRLDARRCISYLTIEHKGPIPRELRPLLGNRHLRLRRLPGRLSVEQFAQSGREAKLAVRESLREPSLAQLARLDDAAFRRLFANLRSSGRAAIALFATFWWRLAFRRRRPCSEC